VASAAVGAWFGFGFIAVTTRAASTGGGEIIYGLPPVMRALAWAPVVIALLATVLVVATMVAWRRRWWSVPSLVLYTIVAINAGLFAALLVRWGYYPVATG